MKIGIDIDGVIWDYERLMYEYAKFYNKYILKRNGIDHEEEFFYLDKFDWTEEEKNNFMDTFSMRATLQCGLIYFSKEGINLLRELGLELICITARGEYSNRIMNIVSERLTREGIFFDKIFWKSGNKIDVCKSENIDFMIDDSPNNCERLAANGIKCIYLNTSNSVHLINENIIETSSWLEVCEYFISLVNKKINYSRILN